PPLVAALAGVPDDDREHVYTEVVVVRSDNGATDREASVPAAEVEHDGGDTAEQFPPVQPPLRHRPQRGLHPLLLWQHFAGEGDAERSLGPAGRWVHGGSLGNGGRKPSMIIPPGGRASRSPPTAECSSR